MREIIRRREVVSDDWRNDRRGPEGEKRCPDPAIGSLAPRARAVVRVERARRVCASVLRTGWNCCGQTCPGCRSSPSSSPRPARIAAPARRACCGTASISPAKFAPSGMSSVTRVFFMARCGIDSFRLAPGVDPQSVLAAFDDFDVAYQPSSVQVQHQRDFYAT